MVEGSSRDQHARRYDASERLASILNSQSEFGSREMDVKGLMEAVAQRAEQILQADGVAVSVLEGPRLVCRAASGSLRREVDRSIVAEESTLLKAVASGDAYRSHDLERDPLVAEPHLLDLGARSLLAAPLRQDLHVVGVASAVSSDRSAFDDLDGLTLQFFAGVVVSGMERWRQYKARHALLDEKTREHRRHKEAEGRFWVVFEASPVAMALLGDELEIARANDAAGRLFGVAPADLRFHHLSTLLRGSDVPSRTGDAQSFLARVARPDGATSSVRLHLRPLPASPGETMLTLATFEDLSGTPPPAAPSVVQESHEGPAPAALLPARFDLAPVLARSLGAFLPLARRNNVRIDTRLGQGLIVQGDASMLEYAVRTVVDNVVRATPAYSAVLVQAGVTSAPGPAGRSADSPPVPSVVVQFSGASLVADRLERLLHAQPRDGLGLEEAHRILALHGGRMWTRALQQGALLGFSLAASK